jgi:hypothetical protein
MAEMRDMIVQAQCKREVELEIVGGVGLEIGYNWGADFVVVDGKIVGLVGIPESIEVDILLVVDCNHVTYIVDRI